MFIDMLAHMPENAVYPSLRFGVIGGTMVPEQLLKRIKRRLNIRMLVRVPFLPGVSLLT